MHGAQLKAEASVSVLLGQRTRLEFQINALTVMCLQRSHNHHLHCNERVKNITAKKCNNRCFITIFDKHKNYSVKVL